MYLLLDFNWTFFTTLASILKFLYDVFSKHVCKSAFTCIGMEAKTYIKKLKYSQSLLEFLYKKTTKICLTILCKIWLVQSILQTCELVLIHKWKKISLKFALYETNRTQHTVSTKIISTGLTTPGFSIMLSIF